MFDKYPIIFVASLSTLLLMFSQMLRQQQIDENSNLNAKLTYVSCPLKQTQTAPGSVRKFRRLQPVVLSSQQIPKIHQTNLLKLFSSIYVPFLHSHSNRKLHKQNFEKFSIISVFPLF